MPERSGISAISAASFASFGVSGRTSACSSFTFRSIFFAIMSSLGVYFFGIGFIRMISQLFSFNKSAQYARNGGMSS